MGIRDLRQYEGNCDNLIWDIWCPWNDLNHNLPNTSLKHYYYFSQYDCEDFYCYLGYGIIWCGSWVSVFHRYTLLPWWQSWYVWDSVLYHMTTYYQPLRPQFEHLTAVIPEISTEPCDYLLSTYQTTVSKFDNCYSWASNTVGVKDILESVLREGKDRYV